MRATLRGFDDALMAAAGVHRVQPRAATSTSSGWGRPLRDSYRPHGCPQHDLRMVAGVEAAPADDTGFVAELAADHRRRRIRGIGPPCRDASHQLLRRGVEPEAGKAYAR